MNAYVDSDLGVDPGYRPDAVALNNLDAAAQRNQIAGAITDLGTGISVAVFRKRVGLTSPCNPIKLDGSKSFALALNNVFPSQVVGWVEINRNRLVSIALWLIIMAGIHIPANASHPRDFVIEASTPKNGAVGPVVAKVRVSSRVDTAVSILIREATSTDRRDGAPIDRSRLKRLGPRKSTSASLSLNIGSTPIQMVVIEAVVVDSAARQIQSETTHLYFRAVNGRYRSISEPEAFLVPRTRQPKLIGGSVYDLTTVSGKTAEVVRETASKLTFGSLAKPGAVMDLRPSLDRIAQVKPDFRNQMLERLSVRHQRAGGETLPQLAEAGAQQFIVTGSFSYVGLDNTWHPGWNWIAKLSWTDPGGDDHELARDYVKPDGSWSMTFAALGYSGQNLFIQYAPQSRFVRIVDKDGDEYWWHSSRRENITAAYDVGAEAADTSAAGALSGLGDVYDHAIVFWNGFYTMGVDPKRDEAIRIHYPNTSYKCGRNTPWSCANSSGEIWIIPIHADAFTVQHELAHQLNYEFWGDIEGGDEHSTLNCSRPQVALSEGFADVVPYWLTQAFDNVSPVVGGGPRDIELPSPARCVGDWNEWHVATTFWDLADRNLDGTDAVNLDPSTLPLLGYLWAGQKTSLRFYLPEHTILTPLPNSRARDVYQNNKIDTP